MKKKSGHIVLLVALFSCGVGWHSNAQTSSYEELQAAYIFNFAKYVTWPAQSPAFVIGIYGEVEIKGFLEKAFSDKKIGGKTAEVRALSAGDDIAECNIIYVPQSGSKNIRALIAAVGAKSILVVTEDDLIKRGASISFIVEEDRLKFKLKESALATAKLKASEGLLKLAILE